METLEQRRLRQRTAYHKSKAKRQAQQRASYQRRREQRLAWARKRQKEKGHLRRASQLKSRFGITQREYIQLFLKQLGRCAICGDQDQSQKSLAVDHCHSTGVVRGLLCAPCNVSLGNFKDNFRLLLKAAAYLKQHATKSKTASGEPGSQTGD